MTGYGTTSAIAVMTLVMIIGLSKHGNGLSYGTAGNSATIHGSPGLYRRDYGGYKGRASGSRYSSYGGYSPSSGSSDEVQKETKYYYGGKYQGSCVTDGLYYRDDTTFIICSNGYPHEQPCPPGTKTSGSPRYQPGYYYGYTDLCSVNLVDYGYGPEYYAPRGYPYISAKQREYGSASGSGGYSGHGGAGRGYGSESRSVPPLSPSVGYSAGSSLSAGGYGSGYRATQGARKTPYSSPDMSQGHASSEASDYASSGSSAGSKGATSGSAGGSDSLRSGYQRESGASRPTYQEAKSPYLSDSSGTARSGSYAGSPSYGASSYAGSYGSRDSLYPINSAGTQHN